MSLIDRLGVETAALHADADAEMGALLGASSAADYRRFLVRTYGFTCPVERAIANVPGIERYASAWYHRGMLTRRGFLGAACGALAAAGCGGGAEDRFAGFAIGVQTWTFREFSLEETLAMAARLGLAHVEPTPAGVAPGHLPFPAGDAEIDALRATIAAHGLACLTAHIAPLGVDYPIDRAAFEYGRRLGVRTIMATEVPASGAELDALVAEFDIRIGLHNHTGSRFDGIEDVRAVLDGRDPRVGTIVDTGHYTRVGLDPVAALRAFAGRVHGLHLKDVVAADPAAPDAILGEGVIDLVGIFRALREIELPADASISIEYESNPFMPYDDLARALDHIEDAAHASLRA